LWSVTEHPQGSSTTIVARAPHEGVS